jgi:DNA-directed RNA polymerase subunit beta'
MLIKLNLLYHQDKIKVHSTIISRFETIDENGKKKFEKYTSTAGRFLLANLLPKI